MHLAGIIAASIAALAAVIVYRQLPSTNLHTVVQPVAELSGEPAFDPA
jgi:uncharacterized membrane protein YccC